MPTDPRKLRPSDLCRLLNSTPLGEVINERQLHRHRTRAGMRIGDGRFVDLLRYIAWLVTLRHAPKPEPPRDPYEKLKERARARNLALAIAGRDIGELPEVVNPSRKARAATDFRFFCESYFPRTFHLPWSPDHLKVIGKIEQAVLRGGLFAMAMPRGSGKTSICECACIWAVLNGHREFVCLIGSDEGHAMDMLESIKMELDGNDLLLEDFPEVVFPIQCLDGIANRCNGQLYKGERTHIGWTAREIVLPTIPNSKASGAIIKVAGITGRIRGMKYKRADGQTVRPSLVVIDDPQTDESARSLAQCATRESILAGAILGLAGPAKKISGIMPCTVIRPSDMADNILDREKHPEWNGERTKMVYSFPTNEKLWQQYGELRATSLRDRGDISLATEFYVAHRDEMDAGAVVAWPERFNHDEVSAIQHAMNLKLQDEPAFWAEYQNEPLPEIDPTAKELTAEEIARKTNGLPRATPPLNTQWITAFVDVQQKALYYTVTAWGTDFSGAVIDYGTYPRQRQPYYTLATLRHTLQREFPGHALEAAIRAGLEALTADLFAREWTREDSAAMKLNIALVDASWGTTTAVVYEFCRRARVTILPSHGRYIGASSQPMNERKRQPGEHVGHYWRIPSTVGRNVCRHVLYDANYWKSFLAARWAAPHGTPGSLSLWGEDPKQHQMFAEHFTAEYRVSVAAAGRVVDEWKQRPDRRDNHFLDCQTGCAVAASMMGATLPALATKPNKSVTPTNQSAPKPRRQRVFYP